MIKAIESFDNSFENFCENDALGIRAFALFKAYKTDKPYAHFWYQTDELGDVCAFIAKTDSTVTVSADRVRSDIGEIADFCALIKYDFLNVHPSVAEEFDGAVTFTGNVMKRRHDAPFLISDPDADIRLNTLYDKLYFILQHNNSSAINQADYELWENDITMRTESGTCRSAVLLDRDIAVSCAMILAETSHAALIGSVATEPQFRLLGHAKAVIAKLISLVPGKDIYVICKDDKVPFYANLGFTPSGRTCEVTDR